MESRPWKWARTSRGPTAAPGRRRKKAAVVRATKMKMKVRREVVDAVDEMKKKMKKKKVR